MYILFVENLVSLFMRQAALYFPEHLEITSDFKKTAIAKMRQLLIKVVHETCIESECTPWLNNKKYLY